MAAGSRCGRSSGEGDGGEEDSGEEGGAVAVVEVVAGFEVCVEWGGSSRSAGVQQTVGGVEHPDGEGHGEGGGEGEMDVVGGGDEPGPESGDGGGVEGEKMPEREGRLAWLATVVIVRAQSDGRRWVDDCDSKADPRRGCTSKKGKADRPD